MTSYDLIVDCQNILVKYWGEKGKDVIVECAKVNPFNADFKHFLTYCTACGGNWGGMILSGIRELYPNVWEAIPDKIGAHAFDCICCTIVLCGVDLD